MAMLVAALNQRPPASPSGMWMKKPEFDAAYRKARRAAFAQTIARLHPGFSATATTLLKLMMDPATPPSTRARCSESVISFASKAIELEDIEARVSELERHAGGIQALAVRIAPDR